MKTSETIIDPAHPYENREDGKFYFHVSFYKNIENTVVKIHPESKEVQDYQNFH